MPQMAQPTDLTPTGWRPSPTDWDMIPGNEHVRRAIEIAFIGGHSIFIVGPRGSYAEDLAHFARGRGMAAYAAWPCACGRSTGEFCETCGANAQDEYIRSHYPPAGAVDIYIEARAEVGPRGPGEAWRNAVHRANDAAPWMNEDGAKMELDAAGVALLRAATAMLALDEDACSRIKHVARTIACAAHSEFIRTPHLAEAIQYRPPAYVVTVTTPAKEDD